VNNIRTVVFIAGLLSCVCGYAEDSLQLIMTGSNRAIVVLNSERLVLKAGETGNARIRLIESNSDRAVLNLDGKRVVLETDAVAAPILDDALAGLSPISQSEPAEEPSQSSGRSITLWAEDDGFFYADAKVNRKPVRFLVDTGATTVTFSSQQADSIGLDYQNGRIGYASTASGITPTRSITLDKVSIGRITVRNVEASIIPGRFPQDPLLGGTFLSQVNMNRSGKKMQLKKR